MCISAPLSPGNTAAAAAFHEVLPAKQTVRVIPANRSRPRHLGTDGQVFVGDPARARPARGLTLYTSVLSHHLPDRRRSAKIDVVVREVFAVSENGRARTCSQAHVAPATEWAARALVPFIRQCVAIARQPCGLQWCASCSPRSPRPYTPFCRDFRATTHPSAESLDASRLTSVKGML